ncbi:MAG: hypothetical protein AAF206_09160 [Bacteroidota bacterium]
MKLLRVFSFFILWSLSTFSQTTDWEKMSLIGKVKQVRIKECLLQGQGSDARKICKVQRVFYFNEHGALTKRLTYEFDQLVESDQYCYKDGVLQQIVCSGADTHVKRFTVFSYDGDGDCVEEKIFTGKAVPTTQYLYQYDAQHRKIDMKGYNLRDNEKCFVHEQYRYDAMGNRAEKRSDKRIDNYQYQYDEKEQLMSLIETHAQNGKIVSRIQTRFIDNSAGQCREEVRSEGEREISTLYQLDELGNWVRKTTIESAERTILTEREFDYF